MKLIKKVKRALLERKFASQNLNIIQSINATQFADILNDLKVQGWQFDAYQGSFNPKYEKWSDTLRKGQSSLNFAWDQKQQGAITGPSRIVKGLGETYKLLVLGKPRETS
jgi:uncharacterized protein YbbC (DUF1343 family)